MRLRKLGQVKRREQSCSGRFCRRNSRRDRFQSGRRVAVQRQNPPLVHHAEGFPDQRTLFIGQADQFFGLGGPPQIAASISSFTGTKD